MWAVEYYIHVSSLGSAGFLFVSIYRLSICRVPRDHFLFPISRMSFHAVRHGVGVAVAFKLTYEYGYSSSNYLQTLKFRWVTSIFENRGGGTIHNGYDAIADRGEDYTKYVFRGCYKCVGQGFSCQWPLAILRMENLWWMCRCPSTRWICMLLASYKDISLLSRTKKWVYA